VDLGLAGGLNRLRSLARSELLVILHDDTEVEAGWLEGLLKVAAAHPEAGAIGSHNLDLDGAEQHLGGVLWAEGVVDLNHPRPGRDPVAVDSTGSSSVLVRAGVWDAVGGASEEFFPAMYVDVDLAMKIWRAGAAVVSTAASRVRHVRSSSTEPAFREFLARRNRAIFLAKWRTELADREPREATPAALERALERAAERWRRATPLAGRGERAALDTAAQERRHLELAVDLYREWSAELEQGEGRARASLADGERLRQAAVEEGGRVLREQVAPAESERPERRARAEAAATLAALEAAEAALARCRQDGEAARAELAALDRLAWWRLYRRLLPLLRALRRLSRRPGANRTE
jgi:GT2 family glycosyltransferase